MAKSKILGAVGDKIVQNAKNNYTATKIANQTGADKKALKKAMNTYSKTAAKDQKKAAKRADRLAKMNQKFGINSFGDMFDTTGKSSDGYDI